MRAHTIFGCIFAATLALPGVRQTGLGQTVSNKEAIPPPFSISIKANPDVVTVGQKIFIQIVLTNLSNHPMAAPSAWLETLDAVYALSLIHI